MTAFCRGHEPQTHYVEGRWLTVAQAAKELGITTNALRLRMSRHGYDLATAVADVRRDREDRAVRQILKDIGADHR